MKNIKILVLFSILLSSSFAWSQADSLMIKNDTVEMAYMQLEKSRIVGAIDVINGDDLRHSTDFCAYSALAGTASGLYVNKSGGAPGSYWANIKVRGLSRGNMGDDPLIVINGIPNRDLSYLTMESIESVTILKDATAKMLYGSQAADGVILVTTKRGHVAQRNIAFSVESGLSQPTALPSYLDAATYAEKYNEARINDGQEALYSAADIAAYRDQTSPLLYPDMDYYHTFLNKSSSYKRVNSLLSGGDQQTQYFLNVEFLSQGSLVAIGDAGSYNQLNLISNLTYQVNDIISVNLDISSKIGLQNDLNINSSSLFQGLSTHRPNDYPFFVTDDQSVDTDRLAYNTIGAYNLYGEVSRGGYKKRQDFSSFSNLGLDFDLNAYVKGLTAEVRLGFDTYNQIYTGKDLDYSTYRIVTADSLVRIGDDEVQAYEQKFSDDFTRNVAGHGKIMYNRSFDKHAITANVIYSMRQFAYKSTESWESGVRQDYKGVNLGANINYAFDSRYVLEASTSYMGSDKFERGKRFKPYGAVGIGWMVSNEDFLATADAVDHLKFKASYGTMGYDKMMDYYLYRSAYSGAGAYFFGINAADGTDYATYLSKLGNSDITFEESTELNIGFEAILLNSVSFEANYFNELRTGIPTELNSTLPGYLSSIAPIGNYNIIRNTGFDMAFQYQKNFGDFDLEIGANLIYSEARYEQFDENNIYEHQNLEGKVVDVYFGLEDQGLYAGTEDISAHGVSSALGEILPGDIRYLDYTNDLNDNLIDEYDFHEIGHWFPRYSYGINIDLKYKGFSLYALGQGISDVDRLTMNSYYLNFGEGKYSEAVLAADYPRLTTNTAGGHSYVSSTYWMENGAYFKLRMLELSYDFLLNTADDMNVKVYLKGTDLFTLTKFKDLDPEDISAGVSRYPLFTTVSLGAKLNF